MPQVLRVLLAEDVAGDAELELRYLKRAGLAVDMRVVETESAFRGALLDFRPDVILSDFSMPSFDGMSALALSEAHAPDVPFIFVSGTLGEEHAIRALKSGAVDYVLKDNLMRLPSAVERAVEESRGRRARRRVEAELEATRGRLASIIATLSDALWSVDASSGAFLEASPAMEAIYGRPPSAFLNDPDLWLRVVHPDDQARVRAAWAQVAAGQPLDLEYRIVLPDERTRCVHNRGRRIQAGDGVRIDGVARDITVQAEQRRRIDRLSRIREVNSAINNAIVRIGERRELLDEACRVAVELGGMSLARIALAGEDGKLHIWAARGRGAEVFGAAREGVRKRGIDPAGGLVGKAMRSGDVVVHNDIQRDISGRARQWMVDHDVRSGAAFPLLIDGVPVGALALHAREAGYFDREEVALLKEIAANIAFALSLREKQEKLNYLAYYDPLTGLFNRTHFRASLAEAVGQASRHGGQLAVVAFDIARFRAVNEAFGQQAGDRMLREVATRLSHAAGDEARVSRLGGDDFWLLLPVANDVAGATRELLERAAQRLDLPMRVEGRELRLSTRAGIAVYPHDGDDADAVFRSAEAALDRGRASGERFTFYAPEMNRRYSERLEFEGRLRYALEKNELELHYQPKVDTVTRELRGLEALMRWRDPKVGLVMPGRFIPVMEEIGLIGAAGHWAMCEAVRTRRDWLSKGLKPPRIAVNMSALQLRHGGFLDHVREAIGPDGDHGLDLEITESLLMENLSESIHKLHAVRDLGVQISIDDFGTGYSSLAYINRLPINLLKIDRSFVSGVARGEEAPGIVSAIISLARGLHLQVVAEGVETEEQASVLQSLHCDLLQGHLTGAPMPAAAVEQWLEQAASP